MGARPAPHDPSELARRARLLPVAQRSRTGDRFRLPSESEWEYECRAGTTTPFSFGETIAPEQANYGGEHFERTTLVGSFPPKAFGLFDMHCNVREWCADAWNENLLRRSRE